MFLKKTQALRDKLARLAELQLTHTANIELKEKVVEILSPALKNREVVIEYGMGSPNIIISSRGKGKWVVYGEFWIVFRDMSNPRQDSSWRYEGYLREKPWMQQLKELSEELVELSDAMPIGTLIVNL